MKYANVLHFFLRLYDALFYIFMNDFCTNDYIFMNECLHNQQLHITQLCITQLCVCRFVAEYLR